MSKLKFSKMHGAGNDFMVINAIESGFVPTKEQLTAWSDRNFGVGFDQLLLVQKPETAGADFKYRIFNSDGSEVNQCGNGARCFARFVLDNNLIENKTIKVETGAGQMTLEVLDNGEVRVDMGVPEFRPGTIPLLQDTEKNFYKINVENTEYEFMAVAIGNPHAVFIVDDVAEFPVAELGRSLESHSYFPQRVNVGFMQILDKNSIKLRVYERGAGETLACGSGACAAVACGINARLLTNKVKVMVSGGELLIEWQGKGEHIFMTGPAVTVYKGELEI